MKKKFLIPVVGLFVCAMTFSSLGNSSVSTTSGLFIESDNIALAEGNGWWCMYCRTCSDSCQGYRNSKMMYF